MRITFGVKITKIGQPYNSSRMNRLCRRPINGRQKFLRFLTQVKPLVCFYIDNNVIVRVKVVDGLNTPHIFTTITGHLIVFREKRTIDFCFITSEWKNCLWNGLHFTFSFFCSGPHESEAQSGAHAFVLVQRFQSQRADVRVHRPGRVPDVRRQLRTAAQPVQLRTAAGHARRLRVAGGHPGLLRATAVGRRGTAGSGSRRFDQQTATVRRRVVLGQSTARVRTTEIGIASRF